MSQAEKLYRESVLLAEQADIARIKHPQVDYKGLFEQAFVLQKQAAQWMSPEEVYPMYRTEMMQSAAALAYKAGKMEEAEKMIALCRSENPPAFVEQDLKKLEALIRQATATPPKNGSLQVKGILTQANADEKEITIRDMENQRTYAFIVPSKIFKNVVKDYWQELVSAVGKASPHGVFTLEKISPAA